MGNGIPSRLLGAGRAKLARLGLPVRPAVVSASLTTPSAPLTPPVGQSFISSDGVAKNAPTLFPTASTPLPTSFASSLRTFAGAAKATITSPFQAKEVVRTGDGRVVGPPSQYILSALNNNRAPFGMSTAARTLAYLALLYGVMKAGVFNSPVDLVSAADSIVDTAVDLGVTTFNGNPELHAGYFNGFLSSVYKCDSAKATDIPGKTCYAPGGTYYQQVVQNPDHARLWGYLGGLTPQQKEVLFGLLLSGGAAAFIYANRRGLRTMVQGLTSNGPRIGTADLQQMGVSAAKVGTTTLGALALSLGVSRDVAHPVAAWLMIGGAVVMLAKEYGGAIQQIPGAKEMTFRRALFYGLLWAGGEGIYRALADSAGVYQFTPTGHETIYGNWHSWDWVMNAPLLAADLATELMLLAPWWARAGGLVQNSTEVGVALLSRTIHDNPETAGPIRKWMQGALPKLGSPTDPITGQSLPTHLSVRPQIQAFTQAERDAVREGRMPEGMLSAGVGHGLTLGAAGFLGYTGFNSLTELMAGGSHHTVTDVLLTTLGLGATGVLADAAVRNGLGRRLYSSMSSLLAHQFGPSGRGPFWLMYTVVGTAMTATLGVTSQTIKGFDINSEYLKNILKRAVLNPWVNRLQMGLLTAYWPEAPISKFRFFGLGFFTVYCGIEFSAQTAQSMDQLFKSDARDFALSSDPDHQAELLGKLSAREALVRDAIAHDGFGRPETLQRAKDALNAILLSKTQYGIPEVPSHDSH